MDKLDFINEVEDMGLQVKQDFCILEIYECRVTRNKANYIPKKQIHLLASVGLADNYALTILSAIDKYEDKDSLLDLLMEFTSTRVKKPVFLLAEGTYLYSLVAGGWTTAPIDVGGTISIETTWNKEVALEAIEEEIDRVHRSAPWLKFMLKQV